MRLPPIPTWVLGLLAPAIGALFLPIPTWLLGLLSAAVVGLFFYSVVAEVIR